MINKNVQQINDGVKISFTGDVKKQNITQIVQNCSSGKCECMNTDMKKKISNMEVDGDDGNISLNISGDITKEEIEDALSKSKVLH